MRADGLSTGAAVAGREGGAAAAGFGAGAAAGGGALGKGFGFGGAPAAAPAPSPSMPRMPPTAIVPPGWTRISERMPAFWIFFLKRFNALSILSPGETSTSANRFSPRFLF